MDLVRNSLSSRRRRRAPFFLSLSLSLSQRVANEEMLERMEKGKLKGKLDASHFFSLSLSKECCYHHFRRRHHQRERRLRVVVQKATDEVWFTRRHHLRHHHHHLPQTRKYW